MTQSHQNELTDPITMDWLEDPIVLPCCGRAISRESILLHKQHNSECPLCRGDLSNYDAQIAPKSINIAYMVELERSKTESNNISQSQSQSQSQTNSAWKAKVEYLSTNTYNETVIGKLQFSHSSGKSMFKTLLVPVIDDSGSMSGNPIKQVRSSLDRLLDITYKNSHILTHMVTYGSYAQNYEINKTKPMVEYRNKVQTLMGSSGGTSFESAFSEILKLCEKYKTDKSVNNIVVLFLTDGEDSSVSRQDRGRLVNKFKTDMDKICHIDYVVHTIGFGSSHDFDFLNNLRMIGSSEGAYRFADPSENDDSLFGKINSVIDAIAKTHSIPLKIKDSPFPIISDNGDHYWLNMSDVPLNVEHHISVIINDEDTIDILLELESENGPELWNEYYTHLIDEIASELLIISSQKECLEKQLHSELIEQRSKAILLKLDKDSQNYTRTEKLIETIKILRSGGTVSQLKLNDMKFEGKFATNTVIKNTPNTSNILTTASKKVFNPVSSWETIRLNINRIKYDVNVEDVFYVIARFSNNDSRQWINKNVELWEDSIDDNGANPLIVASSVGKIDLVRDIIKHKVFDINATNKFGYNATDMAALYGYWISYGILVENGGKPTIAQSLLRTCLSNGHVNTSGQLVKDGFAVVTEDLINSAPNNTIYAWLSSKTVKRISVEDAILKGMLDIVKEDIDNVTNFSWNHYKDILVNPSDEHLQIIDLLLSNGKANANEVFEIDDGAEISWPLFAACEKGNMPLFELLLNYVDSKNINKQNRKGTTVLWIACCNKHIDIVIMLLQLGADPNISNYKGDGPLIPCCQKGSEAIASILLDSGASLEVFNVNRDNPVLIACRTGQAKILELFLKRLELNKLKNILETCAEIDGFCPLLASTELDRTECIKVCVKYGANLEHKSADDNKIIAGATALHLGCFYGRFGAVKILCELGADIKAQTNNEGYTPMHVAIKQGHIHIVKYLLTLPAGKETLEIHDFNGRLPRYYCSNELLTEIFSNKLATLLGEIIVSDIDTEKNCAEILVKYGRSLGCYDYDEIHKLNLGNGMSPLSYAILNGNVHLLEAFNKMKANIYNTDDYGISPLFWATYLNYRMVGIEPTEQIVNMITNVNNIVGNNLQNKMLLSLPRGIPKLECQYNEPSTLIKMKDGYGYDVPADTLVNLRKTSNGNHLLLGFIEKLKNNNMFSDGKQILEYILWDSKIHLIKLLALGEKILQPTHMLSIYWFSSNLTMFQQVNRALCKWTPNNSWTSFVRCLYQAINLLPPHIGEVYRVVDNNFNLDELQIGNTITWNNFSTCSSEPKICIEQLSKKKGIVFIIQSLNGKNISYYSKNPNNAEVVFLPETTFKIKNYYKPDIIVLGQANIRNSTYKITEKDIEKALKQEACIIVELEECENNLLLDN